MMIACISASCQVLYSLNSPALESSIKSVLCDE
jgi:hypothetical protein